MRARKIPSVHALHPNVTPLIDIVMCLVIFYMLVAKIGVSTGAARNIELPKSLQGSRLSDPGNTVTLNVLPGLRGAPVVTALDAFGAGEMVSLEILGSAGERPLLNFLKQARGSNTEFKVVIRADKDLEYSFIEPVLITCTEAQVKSVNFATQQQTEVLTGGRP